MTGEDFKKWRERIGLTQAQVAIALDVTEMTIYRWESGKGVISRAIELATRHIESEMTPERRPFFPPVQTGQPVQMLRKTRESKDKK